MDQQDSLGQRESDDDGNDGIIVKKLVCQRLFFSVPEGAQVKKLH